MASPQQRRTAVFPRCCWPVPRNHRHTSVTEHPVGDGGDSPDVSILAHGRASDTGVSLPKILHSPKLRRGKKVSHGAQTKQNSEYLACHPLALPPQTHLQKEAVGGKRAHGCQGAATRAVSVDLDTRGGEGEARPLAGAGPALTREQGSGGQSARTHPSCRGVGRSRSLGQLPAQGLGCRTQLPGFLDTPLPPS